MILTTQYVMRGKVTGISERSYLLGTKVHDRGEKTEWIEEIRSSKTWHITIGNYSFNVGEKPVDFEIGMEVELVLRPRLPGKEQGNANTDNPQRSERETKRLPPLVPSPRGTGHKDIPDNPG